MKLCRIRGCERPSKSRGFCDRHYADIDRRVRLGRAEWPVVHTGAIRLGDVFSRIGWVFDVDGDKIVIRQDGDLSEDVRHHVMTEKQVRGYELIAKNEPGRVIRSAIR